MNSRRIGRSAMRNDPPRRPRKGDPVLYLGIAHRVLRRKRVDHPLAGPQDAYSLLLLNPANNNVCWADESDVVVVVGPVDAPGDTHADAVTDPVAAAHIAGGSRLIASTLSALDRLAQLEAIAARIGEPDDPPDAAFFKDNAAAFLEILAILGDAG